MAGRVVAATAAKVIGCDEGAVGLRGAVLVAIRPSLSPVAPSCAAAVRARHSASRTSCRWR